MAAVDIAAALKATLDAAGCIEDTLLVAAEVGVPHADVIGVANSLIAKGYVAKTQLESSSTGLTEEGLSFAQAGSAEAQVYAAVPEGGIAQSELSDKLGAIARMGMSKAMQAKFIRVEKSANGATVHRNVPEIQDTVAEQLRTLAATGFLPAAELDALKKRKLVAVTVTKSFKLTPDAGYAEWGSGKQPASDLTPDMLSGDKWKEFTFKPVNLDAMGSDVASGHLHPLMKVRTQFRQIFLEMGFAEMETNRYVESSFWNFDALFQPQQHPARDMHDTFFIKSPARALTLPTEYVEGVKRMHTSGGFGSTGWRYDWSEEESRKNLLRTHTTAVSSRTLYDIAQHAKRSKDGFKPGKYFSIDRVFRNEALDATHLAEFHQVEGFIIARNLTLGHLLGVLQEFFGRLGMSGLKFKPTYNPYTEPSLEIHAWHEGLGRIVEVGNSGVFRPEMLRPMGFDDDVSVIAWGLSLERPTMIRYKVKNIRDLFGHKVDVGMVKSNPMCRLGYE
ncbi:tRNA synthetases class 2 core domain (F) [Pavlovales sp. CCMP2436]|nr:tRNA synthetases class 2 core domain (F) [Pavlovales sp. CCMP2436]|mmetsp:Transcript_24307/g.57601  ORF Transcript_24307/g.57601 Transcript_24307/m.57601 type:complete len:504 (+) Transcript_24307:35-1546(+)